MYASVCAYVCLCMHTLNAYNFSNESHKYFKFASNICSFTSMVMWYSLFDSHICFSHISFFFKFFTCHLQPVHTSVSIHSPNVYEVLRELQIFSLAAIFVLLHLWSHMYSLFGRHVWFFFSSWQYLLNCRYMYPYTVLTPVKCWMMSQIFYIWRQYFLLHLWSLKYSLFGSLWSFKRQLKICYNCQPPLFFPQL